MEQSELLHLVVSVPSLAASMAYTHTCRRALAGRQGGRGVFNAVSVTNHHDLAFIGQGRRSATDRYGISFCRF